MPFLLLALLTFAPALADEPTRDERRVLRLEELADQELSEAYRAAARIKRHESIDMLKEILANRALDGERRAEMLLRLAELCADEGRDLHLDEMRRYDDAMASCFDAPGCPVEEVVADHGESTRWRGKAIQLYQQVLSNYPTYGRADDATFFLAATLGELGEADRALRTYTDLVKAYPQSNHAADAYLQIGEYWFDHDVAIKALLAYQQAARFREGDRYPFALYKLAWCQYNVGELSAAIENMKAVVSWSQDAVGAGDPRQRITLQDEALKDLVRFFADDGDLDEAFRYLTRLGRTDLVEPLFRRLAGIQMENGQYEQAVQTWRRLLAQDPDSAAAPAWQHEIVQALTRQGRRKDTVAEVERLRKTYGRGSAWARSHSTDSDALAQAGQRIEEDLRAVALSLHDEARRLGAGPQAREAYALAAVTYQAYLDEVSAAPHRTEVQYAYGELLYKVGRFEDAYAQYVAVVVADPTGEHAEFCAEAAIFAAEKVVAAEGPADKAPSSTQAVPLTAWEDKLVEACEQYAALFDGPKVKVALTKAAQLYYSRNHFQQASVGFRRVIALDPGSEQAMVAANLLLDSFNLVGDWKSLREVALAFYEQPGLGDARFKQQARTIYERASFKLIEADHDAGGSDGAAAERYMAFVVEFPRSDVGDLALNNAAVFFGRAGQTRQAIAARTMLVDRYPDSPRVPDQLAALGFECESLADFAGAAEWYEELFDRDAGHEAAREAIYSAALFRSALGEWQRAVDDYEHFVDSWPGDERVPSLLVEQAGLFATHGQPQEAARRYRSLFERPPRGMSVDQQMFCRLQYGLVMESLGQAPRARQHFDETLAWYSGLEASETGAAREMAARIMFRQADAQLQAYMALSIEGPGQRRLTHERTNLLLAEQLRTKVDALGKVEQTYKGIIDTGAGEWGLASLVALGRSYENMALALTESWIPDWLTPEQRELYVLALEDKAWAQNEKAVQVYDQALRTSRQLAQYDDNAAFATRRLGALRPGDYTGLDEQVPPPRFVARAVREEGLETEP